MKLSKLALAISSVRNEYGIDATDLLVLNDIMRVKHTAGEVTIMEIVDKCKAASPATIHARIKSLCIKGMLIKVEHASNLRLRMLEKGPNYDKLIDILEAA
jgi:hypothetical protein